MDSTQRSPGNGPHHLLGAAAQAVGHMSMILVIAILIAWAVLPVPSLKMLFQYSTNIPDIRSMNLSSILLQFGLASCIWAMCVIIYKLIALHRDTPRTTRFQPSRGSVMTETLIIFPIFFLLLFGLAQLSINNMAGMLANVAVFEAARAVWIWQPEVDSQRFPDEKPADRARIAAALVMTPVAPGEYRIITTGDDLSDHFKASRKAMLASQVPFGGVLSDLLPDGALGIGTAALPGTQQGNLALFKGLDSKKFIVRSYTKYTHAYLATDIKVINDGSKLGVKLTYQHNQVMPVVGKIFGTKVGGPLGLGGPGKRAGYYSDYDREFSLPAQPWKPNKQMPQNAWDGGTEPETPDSKCQISSGANENSDSTESFDEGGC